MHSPNSNLFKGYIDSFYVQNLTNRTLGFGDLYNLSIPPRSRIDLLSVNGMTKEMINRSKHLQRAVDNRLIRIIKSHPGNRSQSEKCAILADAYITKPEEDDIDGLYTSYRYIEPTDISDDVIVVGENSDHTTIASGLNAASSGQTVLVMPGTYTQTEVVLIPEGVNLVGWSRDSVIINGVVTGYMVSIVSGNNYIGNLSISNINPVGGGVSTLKILNTATGDTYIYNCRITDSTWDAIVIDPTGGTCIVDSCYFDSLYFDGIVSYTDLIVKNCFVNSTMDVSILTTQTYSETSFLNHVGGNASFYGNIINLSRSAGLVGNISYLRNSNAQVVSKNITSCNNVVQITGNDSNAYGFSASGTFGTARGNNVHYYSCNDLIFVSSSGTSGHIRGNGKNSNIWDVYGGTPREATKFGPFGTSVTNFHYAYT